MADAAEPDPRFHKPPSYTDAYLKTVLQETQSIAAIGVSTNPVRPSYYVAKYLQQKRYRLALVNPVYAGQTLLDQPIYGDLGAIPADQDPIEMVDIFRRSEVAGAVVDEAIEALAGRGLTTIWMQIGVIDWDAAERAEAAGLRVVMNRCPKIEYARLFGELRWGGFNTGVISSKLG